MVHLAQLSSLRLVSPNKRQKVQRLLPCVAHTFRELHISGSTQSWASLCQLLGELALHCADTDVTWAWSIHLQGSAAVHPGVLQEGVWGCNESHHFIRLTVRSCLVESGQSCYSDRLLTNLHWFVWSSWLFIPCYKKVQVHFPVHLLYFMFLYIPPPFSIFSYFSLLILYFLL